MKQKRYKWNFIAINNLDRSVISILKKIIPTMRLSDDPTNYKRIVEMYVRCNIDTVRFNITRYNTNKYIEDINYIDNLYKINNKALNVMLDIPYPGKKIRTCVLNDMEVVSGHLYVFKITEVPEPNVISITDKRINLEIDDTVILGDGELAFKVIEKHLDHIRAIAINSGLLINGRAIYIKERFTLPEKSFDESFISLIQASKPKYIALSFVETPEDITCFKGLISNKLKYVPAIVPKIESQKGIDNLEHILPLSDMVMIGRGDLALTCAGSSLGINQDHIVKTCKSMGVNICVATDILNSMVRNYVPVRSDILDLHHILSTGAGFIVLSAALSINNNLEQAVKFIMEMNEKLLALEK